MCVCECVCVGGGRWRVADEGCRKQNKRAKAKEGIGGGSASQVEGRKNREKNKEQHTRALKKKNKNGKQQKVWRKILSLVAVTCLKCRGGEGMPVCVCVRACVQILCCVIKQCCMQMEEKAASGSTEAWVDVDAPMQTPRRSA